MLKSSSNNFAAMQTRSRAQPLQHQQVNQDLNQHPQHVDPQQDEPHQEDEQFAGNQMQQHQQEQQQQQQQLQHFDIQINLPHLPQKVCSCGFIVTEF